MNKFVETNMDNIVENVLKQLNLKNDKELAEKLNISKNALSMLKQRNSIGTFIEKLLELDEVISIDSILYGTESDELINKINNKIKSKIEILEDQLKELNAKRVR